jgi:transglutaminase-like putative cysteine protease
MPTHASFRFSTYLTLAIACIAVGAAEYEIMPEIAVFGGLSVLALGVLYFLETRVTLLSIPAANRLGGIIIGLYVIWAAYRIKREITLHEFANMGWQTFIVALCGPLVMVTVVAKVARRDKHAGDYWTLHGIALAGMGMSAAFAEETSSFVLVGVYLIAAVWSLTLLYLGRATGVVPAIPGGVQPATKAVAVSADPTGHRTDLRPAIVWAVVALVVAFPLYLLTPRSSELKVDFGKPRIEVGYSADQMVDLTRTGPISPNPEPAFEFTATNENGTPRMDVDFNQRFRGKAFRSYYKGAWTVPSEEEVIGISYARGPWKDGEQLRATRQVSDWTPPNLGPGQFTLSFDVPARLHTSFQADPVLWVPDQPSPLAFLLDNKPRAFLVKADGTFDDLLVRPRGAPRRYVQVYRKPEVLNVSPPFRFVEKGYENRLVPLKHNPVPRVKEFADRALSDLERSGLLPKDWRDDKTLLPKPQHRELIAHLLTTYLAISPDFNYTTDLRLENKTIDPVEDFLFNTKEGHCERYAAALALMLRSQGIPTLYVLGFRGCEHLGDGKYVVRQEYAHAWVEALVPIRDETEDPEEPRTRVYHWISLDPTPGGTDVTEDGSSPWWSQANTWIQSRFQEYVKDYTPEQRRRALDAFFDWVTRPTSLVGIALGIVLLTGIRFGIRRMRMRTLAAAPLPPAEQPRWFNELSKLLVAHGIVPAPGDTLREYALSAALALRERGCVGVAEVPLAWVEAYYQDRFGGIPPSDARLAELETQLDSLRQALEQTRNVNDHRQANASGQ